MATNATADGAKVDMMVAKSRYCPRRRVEVKGLARFQGDPATRFLAKPFGRAALLSALASVKR